MTEKKEKIRGVIGTVLFHLVLFILLYYFGFPHSEETPIEQGIEVNFGTSYKGSGYAEPKPNPKPQESTPKAASQKKANNSAAKTKVNTPPLLTQNIEESLEIKKKKEEEKKKRQEASELKKIQDLEAKEKAENDLKAERERAEQEKQVAIEKAKQEARDQEAAQIQAQTNNAFSTFGKGTSSSKGDGKDKVSGNAGSSTGGFTGSPYGTGSGGNGFSLANRQLVGRLPIPTKSFQEEGFVVVEIEVDRNGNVTQASPILQGSTTQNPQLWKLAKEAALKAKFNVKSDASVYQKGIITYQFTLD